MAKTRRNRQALEKLNHEQARAQENCDQAIREFVKLLAKAAAERDHQAFLKEQSLEMRPKGARRDSK